MVEIFILFVIFLIVTGFVFLLSVLGIPVIGKIQEWRNMAWEKAYETGTRRQEERRKRKEEERKLGIY